MPFIEEGVSSIAERLLTADILGVCVFEPTGAVVRLYGAARFWAPPVGEIIDQAPLFVGLSDRLRTLADEGGSLLLPNLRMAENKSRAFDLRVFRLPDSPLMAAVSVEATERLEFHRQVEQEVRDRRILEERLAQQEEMIAEQARVMRLFIERVPAAVAVIDTDLNEIVTSERWRALSEPADGDRTDEASRRQTDNLRLAIDNGVPSTRVERTVARDGVVWTRWDQTPWRRPDGSVAGAFVAREDVTSSERRIVRLLGRVRELERKHADWRDLAETFATRVAGAAEDSATRADRSAVIRWRAMANAVLDYGRAARRPLRVQRLDLGELVAGVAHALDGRMRAERARLSIGALPTIRGDSEMISGVFQRLIDNVLRHGGQAPSIVIDSQPSDAGVVVRVTDDGPGAPTARRLRAARRFFDAGEGAGAGAKTGAKADTGLGMGLAFCRQAMERHGGSLAIDATWDAGLRVLLTFPDRLPGAAIKSRDFDRDGGSGGRDAPPFP